MSIAQQPLHGESKPDNYLTHSRGFLSWALTLDHKRIGLMYMVSVLTRVCHRRHIRGAAAHVASDAESLDVRPGA